jgi:pimeloyl-ACP methyl ester carboxylesterase
MTNLVLLIAVGLGIVMAAGLLYQTGAAARDRRRYRPPGRLVDVDGMRLHLQEMGEGKPPIVLDSALGGSSMSWYRVQPELARFTGVCSYDRAGFGWSEPAPRPRVAGVITEELHDLLRTAGMQPPLVLVGHSYGSLVCLLYAARYPREVGGVVLVDPPDVDSWSRPDARQAARIERGARLARRAALASRFGLMRLFFSVFGLRAVSAARLTSVGSARPENAGIFHVLEKLPADSRAVLRWLWSEPRSLLTLASLIENVPASAKEVASLELPGDLPIVVLTAANAPAEQRLFHERLAARSNRGRHVVASKSAHWIPLEEPELIIEACRKVIADMREDHPSA